MLLAVFACASSATAAPRGQASVVGGIPAQPGPLSSVAFVTSQTGADSAMACSGTVVAPTVVLTAAHCVVDAATGNPRAASGIAVSVGRVERADTSGGQDLSAADVRVHPAYDARAIRSDAALIFLSAAAAVAPVPLASPAEAALAAPGARAAFAGWGAISGSARDASSRLLTTTTTLLADDACRRLLGGDFDAAVTLCAVDGPGFASSTCRGDSGGPLLLQRGDGAWVQAGITSWGSLGCDPRVPQAFTRVSAISDWVAGQLATAPAVAAPTSGSVSAATTAPTATSDPASRTATVTAARYRGSTRQRRAIAIRVAGGGRTIAGVSFGYRARCDGRWTSASFHAAASTRVKIATSSGGGTFATQRRTGGGRNVRLSGAFARGGRLAGTLRVSWRERGGARCDSGVVRWSARR